MEDKFMLVMINVMKLIYTLAKPEDQVSYEYF